MSTKGTGVNPEQYNQARKEANRICKEKKKQWINNRIKQVEEAHKRNDTRKFFKDIRAFQSDRSFSILACKVKNGTLKTDKQEAMDRWKQYFSDLIVTDKNIDNQVHEVHSIENDIEIEPSTYKEVSDTINKLKRNKAPGTDNIPAELVKYGGYMLKRRMYSLILLNWSNENYLGNGFKELSAQYIKKGERTTWCIYRPITLLNIAYKIFTIILNNRLSKIVESKLSDVRSGLRPNRPTLDIILIVRQTFEKCYEYNIDIHNMFIDYTQAFNSIKINKVLECLTQYNIPAKLQKLIALTLTGTNAIVKINNQFTNKFHVQTGVKQGDSLSATLFSIPMDSILKKVELRGNISTRLKQCTAYADDIVITTRTAQAMIDTYVKLKNRSLKYGLQGNVHKTKYMKCTRRQDQLTPINIENKEFKQVRSFKYLGSIVNRDNAMEEEIKGRIAIGNKVHFANKKIFQSKPISRRALLKLYYSVIRPTVTYSCETWILKETIINKLLVLEGKYSAQTRKMVYCE
jgi:sorting nexin-29